MSCMRDNKVCTKCCEVIHVPVKKDKYLKLYGEHPEESDTGFIRRNWKPIKERIAKKKNPWMFKQIGKHHNMTFWKCKNVSANGCKVHETRPNVCSGYPWYNGSQDLSRPCSYTPSCTVYYNIPIKIIY